MRLDVLAFSAHPGEEIIMAVGVELALFACLPWAGGHSQAPTG